MKKDRFRKEPEGVMYGAPKPKKKGCAALVAGAVVVGAGITVCNLLSRESAETERECNTPAKECIDSAYLEKEAKLRDSILRRNKRLEEEARRRYSLERSGENCVTVYAGPDFYK